MKTFFGEARVPAAVTHVLVNGIRAYDTHEAVQLPGVAIMRTGGRLHLVVEQTRRDGSVRASIFDSRGVLALTVVKSPKRQAAVEPLPPDGWS